MKVKHRLWLNERGNTRNSQDIINTKEHWMSNEMNDNEKQELMAREDWN